MLGWVAREQEKQKHLEQELDQQLKADLQKLGNVAGDKIDTNKFHGLTYEQSQSRKEKFRQLEEKRGLYLTIGGVLSSTGALLVVLGIVVIIFRLVVKASKSIKGSKKESQLTKQEEVKAIAPEPKQQEEHKEKEKEKPVGMFANFATNQRSYKPIGSHMVQSRQKVGVSVSHDKDRHERMSGSLKAAGSSVKSNFATAVSDRDHSSNQSSQSTGSAVMQKDSPNEQHKPLVESMTELTQQVSAIREYASSQQERVKKLQDGYDWGIIKNFCLRIIRCIDNLDNRMASVEKDDGQVKHLQEVKDELIFALESTGVEQFKPEVNSEYRGQEKNAEAVKDKQPNSDKALAGKIARVIRPGYQYFIDDEHFKVVRTAQVKLYA
jgi:molecular chaperone GrpE (heat shock protein)